MQQTLAHYTLHQTLHESVHSIVYRATDSRDGQAVIIKALKETNAEKIAWFQREFDMTRQLNTGDGDKLPCVVEVHQLYHEQQRWFMALEDFGGEDLKRLDLAGQLSLVDFLSLAIQITEALGYVHQRRVIHKDINPANIVAVPPSTSSSTWLIKLIDFGISTQLSQEKTAFSPPSVMEGTLAYISPEQTGRMNRAVDYRSDFYSLGITFYELLTGRLPFHHEDPLALVHQHIAQPPRPPHQLKPDLPPLLSEIILKLMAKNAEDRYQSAYGLKADLQWCLDHLAELRTGTAPSFMLGQSDVSDQFQIPQKLYGREAETARLLASFERVVGFGKQMQADDTQAELILVSGHSGIGKSALVQELHKPITARRGYFIAGKFDQFQRNLPYSAIIQAFAGLVQQLLTESESQLNHWRDQLHSALGDNGQVMVEVIPELERIIGPQPALNDLPPAETRNRFNLVFQHFIQVFTQATHPLVLFLDDLQWADGGSLSLLEHLLTSPESQYFLCIGAYRDNEVPAGHPLVLALERIAEQRGQAVETIQLEPLTEATVATMLADTLHQPVNQVGQLGQIVIDKTQGNPFFVTEFLRALEGDKLLHFDYAQGRWQWDVDKIQAREITANVVTLLGQKVEQLPEATQRLLQTAACLSNRLSLEMWATISDLPSDQVAQTVRPALQAGLMIPLGNAYKIAAQVTSAETLSVTYKFAHDRVQQAVYEGIPAQEKAERHWQIGQRLLNAKAEVDEEHLFDIVNQLNQGRSMLSSVAEQHRLARLNNLAGEKAYASAAFESARTYYKAGLSLLDETVWQTQDDALYQLALNLHIGKAQAAYLNTDFEAMEQLVEQVLTHARTLLDQLPAYIVRIRAYITQSNPRKAVETALRVLASLGIKFPRNPNKAHVAAGLAQAKLAVTRTVGFGKSRIKKLADLPPMTDPHAKAAVRLMEVVSAAVYFISSDLFILLVFRAIHLYLKNGLTAEACQTFGAFGMLHAAVLQDFDSAAEFGKVADQLSQRFDDRLLRGRVLFTNNTFISHWQTHLPELLPQYLNAYQISLESGDMQYAHYNGSNHFIQLYFAGQPLHLVEKGMQRFVELSRQQQLPISV